MKVRILVGLSLALNVYLVFVSFRHKEKGSKPETLNNSGPVVQEIAAAPPTNITAKRFDWQSVETDDYTTYIANLRGIGCPEETIHDIVIADVCKMFEAKKREARKLAPKIDYWRTNT